MIKFFFISLLSLFLLLVLGHELKELTLKKIEKERIKKNENKFSVKLKKCEDVGRNLADFFKSERYSSM